MGDKPLVSDLAAMLNVDRVAAGHLDTRHGVVPDRRRNNHLPVAPPEEPSGRLEVHDRRSGCLQGKQG